MFPSFKESFWLIFLPENSVGKPDFILTDVVDGDISDVIPQVSGFFLPKNFSEKSGIVNQCD